MTDITEADKVTEKKKKPTLMEKFTTIDWMTPKQLKTLNAINIVVAAFLGYVSFLAVNQLSGSAVFGIVTAFIIFVIYASLVTFRIRNQLRHNKGQ